MPDWRLIYIMGTARSGTTMMEILLGNEPGVLNVGEIAHVFRDGFIDDRPCGCGRLFSTCELWGAVRDRLGWTIKDAERHARVSRSIDWHSGFPLTVSGLWSEDRWARYCRIQSEIYDALADVGNARVLVESSIYPGRAVALARCFPNRVRVVCLTRSPEGLVRSFRKPNGLEQRAKSLPGVFSYYAYVLSSVRLALARLGERAFPVSFEEFRSHPEEVLLRIGRWSGIDVYEVIGRLAGDHAFEVGHIVTGNRLRKEGRVRFRRAAADELPRSAAERFTVGLMHLVRRGLAP